MEMQGECTFRHAKDTALLACNIVSQSDFSLAESESDFVGSTRTAGFRRFQ